VTLDFSGVAVFSAVFFNVAIAQLLKDIPPETLRDKLKIEGLPRSWGGVAEEVC
jgi:hypothetical protein